MGPSSASGGSWSHFPKAPLLRERMFAISQTANVWHICIPVHLSATLPRTGWRAGRAGARRETRAGQGAPAAPAAGAGEPGAGGGGAAALRGRSDAAPRSPCSAPQPHRPVPGRRDPSPPGSREPRTPGARPRKPPRQPPQPAEGGSHEAPPPSPYRRPRARPRWARSPAAAGGHQDPHPQGRRSCGARPGPHSPSIRSARTAAILRAAPGRAGQCARQPVAMPPPRLPLLSGGASGGGAATGNRAGHG